MLDRPPDADPRDAVQMSRWMAWVGDRVVHLHECIERKAREAEESSTQRHTENLDALGQMRQSVNLLTVFMENASKEDIAKTAVAGERKRVSDRASEKRGILRSRDWPGCKEAT
jgi:hypothetical protein